jgi:hypothetical protein
VTPVPESVPAGRAVLAGTVETAVNALWDAAPLVGDRIAVVGGGMVGCSVAALLARFPGVRVQLVDADPARAKTAEAFGSRLRAAGGRARRLRPRRPRQRHRTGPHPRAGTPHRRGHGPRTELVRRPEGQPPARRGVPLPPPGHPQQPGRHRLPGRANRSYADRLALALDLLADPALDALVTGESDFEELPDCCPGSPRGRSRRCATGSVTPTSAENRSIPYEQERLT